MAKEQQECSVGQGWRSLYASGSEDKCGFPVPFLMSPLTHFPAPGLHFLFGPHHDYVSKWVSFSSAPGRVERTDDQGMNIHTRDLQGQKRLFPEGSTENFMSPTHKGTGGSRVASEEGPYILLLSSDYWTFGAPFEVAGVWPRSDWQACGTSLIRCHPSVAV